MTKEFTRLEKIVNDMLSKDGIVIKPQTEIRTVYNLKDEDHYVYNLDIKEPRINFRQLKLTVYRDKLEVDSYNGDGNKLIMPLVDKDGFDLLIDHLRSVFSIDYWLVNKCNVNVNPDAEIKIEKLGTDGFNTLISLIKNRDFSLVEMVYSVVDFYCDLSLAKLNRAKRLDDVAKQVMEDLMLKTIGDLMSTRKLELYKITEQFNDEIDDRFVLVEVPNFTDKSVLDTRHAVVKFFFDDFE